MKTRQTIASVALMLVPLATPMAHSHSPTGELMDVSIDDLMRVYLSCERAAVSGHLNGGGIMQCSIVYEDLKQRAFGGDFDKMLAWSKTQPSVQGSGR